MGKARVGVALLLPSRLAAEVDGLRRALGDGSLGRVPAHLTLVPPVNVRDVGAALDVLRAAAEATRPFTVELGPPATFLPDNPVVHLPVRRGENALVELRERVFVAPLARPLTWPFVPHVTLADNAEPERIAAAVESLGSYVVTVTFERVHLLQEEPGRTWVPVADAAFAARHVVARGGLPLEVRVASLAEPEAEALLPPARALELVVTARRDGAVVGVARGALEAAAVVLGDLVVAPEHRDEGVGTQLLAAFLAAASGQGCRDARARVPAGGRVASFLAGRGWTKEADLPRFAAGEDHVQLHRRLD